MPTPTLLHDQLLRFLRQYSQAQDLRHLKALAAMVSALLHTQQLSLSAWEPYVRSRAQKAQSYERRWQRWLLNPRVCIRAIYLPLVLLALKSWQSHRLYLALDTTVVWNRLCMIHLSVVCCGRAVPLLWRVFEHPSASLAFEHYRPLLDQARELLRHHPDVMVLAEWGFANQELLKWLQASPWHYCVRLPADVIVHGPRRYPVTVGQIWPSRGEARLWNQVGLWQEARYRGNLVLAHLDGVADPWAVLTDQPASLKVLWLYSLRFRVEELFLDSKSGAFQLEDSRIRSAQSLERLYLVVALALLYATCEGMAVHLAGLRRQVDPHWRRGLSYLKIGLRWIAGIVHKGRRLLEPVPLLPVDPQPCFASKRAERTHDERIWFDRVHSLRCHPFG